MKLYGIGVIQDRDCVGDVFDVAGVELEPEMWLYSHNFEKDWPIGRVTATHTFKEPNWTWDPIPDGGAPMMGKHPAVVFEASLRRGCAEHHYIETCMREGLSLKHLAFGAYGVVLERTPPDFIKRCRIKGVALLLSNPVHPDYQAYVLPENP